MAKDRPLKFTLCFLAVACALVVLTPSFASAQDKTAAPESHRKLAALFAQAGEKTCSKVSDAEAWECSYRGKGLRQISVRAFLVREDVINADVVMVLSVFAMISDFPDTPDFLRRLLKFNTEVDFGKLSLFEDGRLAVSALCPIRLLDKEQLVLMLDQVAAVNNEAFEAFGKEAK
jgi:hypothetical protein